MAGYSNTRVFVLRALRRFPARKTFMWVFTHSRYIATAYIDRRVLKCGQSIQSKLALANIHAILAQTQH